MNTNCISDEATIKLESSAGPPASSAEMQIAMKADAETTLREYPDPNLHSRKVCGIPPIPHTTSAEKNIQDRSPWDCPPATAMIDTVAAIAAMRVMTLWRPR